MSKIVLLSLLLIIFVIYIVGLIVVPIVITKRTKWCNVINYKDALNVTLTDKYKFINHTVMIYNLNTKYKINNISFEYGTYTCFTYDCPSNKTILYANCNYATSNTYILLLTSPVIKKNNILNIYLFFYISIGTIITASIYSLLLYFCVK
jgi:hypothetical protein